MVKYISSYLFFLTVCTAVQAQSNDAYYEDRTLQYIDKAYLPEIRSVQLYNENEPGSYPIIDMGLKEQLSLHFDDISTNRLRNFYYTLVHCDAKWNPDNLMEMEYLKGFFQGNITQYDPSFNTIQNYYHYQAQIPGPDLEILLSGNYLLLVYENNDKSQLVLTRRFMVVEQSAQVKYTFQRPMDPEERNYLQEIDVTVINPGLQLNSNSDLKVAVIQNGRWDNAVYLNEPKFIRNNEYIYDADEGQQFNGGNEFRLLDIRNLNMKSNNVMHLAHDSANYEAYLFRDERRSAKKHSTINDINGRYLILRDNADDPNVQGDYVWVHFRLATGSVIKEGDPYIFGALSDWQARPQFRMKYDAETGDYTATLLLKQGAYNYCYAVSKDGTTVADDALLEGTHFDTENDYNILIYYHSLRWNADLLVGMHGFNTYR